MAMVFSTGTMELTTKASGISTRQRALEHFGMPRAMYTMESSRMTWQMASESIPILMDPSIKESLETMSRRGMEKRNGLMAPNM